jgi:hypothetical protein
MPEINPYVFLIIVAVAGFVWINADKWMKHICGDFDKTGHHPACFDCNNDGSACYNDIRRCAALRDQLGCSLEDFE